MRKIAAGLIVATLVLAACGGSSKKSGTAAGGSTVTTGGSSDRANAKIKISYTEGSGDSASMFTIAQDANGKRAYTNIDSSDPGSSSTTYSDGKNTIQCEGTGSAAQCTSLPIASAGLATIFLTTFSAIAQFDKVLGGGAKSSDTIAGRDASCVKYTASELVGRLAALPLFKSSSENPSDYDAGDRATICVDKNTGFVLKISATKKGAAEDLLVATAVGEPSDSDFTPPVTPSSLPHVTLPGGPTVPTTPGG